LEILHLWLRQEASRASEMAKSSFISAGTVERTKTVINSNAFRTNTQGITRTKTRLKTAAGLPQSAYYACIIIIFFLNHPLNVANFELDYQANKKLLDDLINKHRAQWREVYNDRLLEEGQTTIAIFDCFTVLQECFYIDQIDLMERASDPEDFFQSVGSYKRLFSLAEDYFLNEKNASPVDFDIKEKTLSFDECLELLYYWIKTDEYVVLIDNRVKDDTGAVKKALLATIENYEQMLQDAKSDIEKQVLQTTVDTLYKKLEELENGAVGGQEPKMSEAEIKRREQKRKRAFKEIFYFYCTQQINAGSAQTFDKLGRLTNTINLGTYKVMLKNFRLKMEHHVSELITY